VVAVTEFVVTCGMFLTDAFWSLYVLALGAEIHELGFFSLITGILPAFIIAPIGYLGDRFSRKKMIIVGGFIAGLGPFLNAFATNWVALIPGTLLASFFPILRPVRQALIAEDIRPSERGKAFATVFTLMMLPQTVMPLIAGVFLDLLGLEVGMLYMLLISSLLRILIVALRFKYIRERKASPIIRPKVKLSVASVKGAMADMFHPLFSIKMLKVMLVGTSASAFSMGMMMRFQSVFVVNVIGLSKTEWGLITAGVSVVRILTRIPLGGLTDRWGRRRCILINYCLQPICIFTLAFSRDFLTVFLAMAARIIVFNFGMPAWEAMLLDISPAKVRGSVYGSLGTVEMFTRSIAPVFGGMVWEALSPEWIFHIAALGRAFSALVLFKFLREPETQEQ